MVKSDSDLSSLDLSDDENDEIEDDSEYSDIEQKEPSELNELETIIDTEEDIIEDDKITCAYTDILNDKISHFSAKNSIVVDKDKRTTRPILTKYEYVRCLSERAKQIALGAKVMIKNASELRKTMSPKEIAMIEIKETRTCPLIIVRPLPNGKEEHWDINELKIIY